VSKRVSARPHFDQQIDPVDKTHCRRRDKFTSYVESSARYKLLMKKSRDSGA